MNFLGILLLVGIAVFFGYQVYGLIKDIKDRKRKAAKRSDHEQKKS